MAVPAELQELRAGVGAVVDPKLRAAPYGYASPPQAQSSTRMETAQATVDPSDFRVLVVGGGIGGLEAVLALRELSKQLPIELLSPRNSFALPPLSVVEPFGADAPPALSIAEFCADHKVEWTRAELAEVWPGQQRALTDTGTELPYDALLIALGARRRPSIDGALHFHGAGEVEQLDRLLELATDEGGRIAFVVPDGPCWPLPLYELAMLAAERTSSANVEILLRTPESTPLEALGESASNKAAELLAAAGVEVRTGAGNEDRGSVPEADWTVSVPNLDLPEIPGLTQGSHGFVATDTEMRVQGVERVWCVGDATWFPVKQGGIATQQADVAAADIAACAGLDVEVPAFAPILRIALLTPEGPYYLRSGDPDSEGEQRAPLWWPPAKVAGRLLAPYLARRVDAGASKDDLIDMELDPRRDPGHAEALGLALTGADIDARAGELKRALHWLAVAEGLNLVVPEEYREKKRLWQRQLDAEARG